MPYYEKGKYDVAILHLDQQCVEDSLWDRGKGSLYRELNETITGIPKIVIIHGTPFYPEIFNDLEVCERFKRAIGNNTVVCNSYTGRLQWAYGMTNATNIIIKAKENGKDWTKLAKQEIDEMGFEEVGIPYEQITPIWHGIESGLFKDLPKDPRVITMINPGGLDRYYDRNFMSAVRDELADRNIGHCHITVDVRFNSFEEYANFIGRSLIYFNPTRESPMPRGRTEAMLSGCCVLTTPGQDADTFIEHGKNGFLIPRKPDKVADLIESLILDYQTALKIGQAGKQTALNLFEYGRYKKEWMDVLNKVINKIC